MKKIFLAISLLSICLFSCGKEKIENRLIGEWKFESQILEDGTFRTDPPYALVEFEYSDGFILNKNNKGFTIWNELINGDEFSWSNTKKFLIIKVENSSGNTTEYEFKISNVENHSMNFETNEGKKYLLKKE